jgi:hypothetical protein
VAKRISEPNAEVLPQVSNVSCTIFSGLGTYSEVSLVHFVSLDGIGAIRVFIIDTLLGMVCSGWIAVVPIFDAMMTIALGFGDYFRKTTGQVRLAAPVLLGTKPTHH